MIFILFVRAMLLLMMLGVPALCVAVTCDSLMRWATQLLIG